MESQIIEYKESWYDECLEWICGYANANGGTLYIGINNSGEVIGIKNPNKLLEDIPNKIKSTLGIVCDVNIRNKGVLLYLEIKTYKMNQVISYKGKVHYRSDSTKQILEGTSLTSFMMRKMGLSWDSLTIENLSLDDFDNDSFRLFKEVAIKNKRLLSSDLNLSNKELMEKLHLIKNGKITYAGMLLFYQKPEEYVPGAIIKIEYFNDKNELVYHDIIKGSLIKQAEETIEIIYHKYLKGYVSYKDELYRIENYQYPKEVVKEAVMNAIIHKLYQSSNPVQIKIFSNKLIIFNECLFPEEWTVEHLFKIHSSRAINRLIADAFYTMGLVETWGQGIEKICNGLKEAKLPPPLITPYKTNFIIEFKSKFYDKNDILNYENDTVNHKNDTVNYKDDTVNHKNDTLNHEDDTLNYENDTLNCENDTLNYENDTLNYENDTLNCENDTLKISEENLLSIIKNNNAVTIIELINIFGKSRATIVRYINILRKKELIERLGSKKTGYWKIK